MVLGLVVGLAAVALPPLGSFAIIALVGLVLLWVMPDLPLVWPEFIRKAFFVMLIADLCIPFYYTIQFAGLPWIAARRLATFTLIVPFVLAIAASSDVRRQIVERIRASKLIVICAVGYLVMAAGVGFDLDGACGVVFSPIRGHTILVCPIHRDDFYN
jgi:hypothetical protein